MKNPFGKKVTTAYRAFYDPEHYLWDSAVIFAEGKYHLYSARWDKSFGFGHSWLFESAICHAVAERPEGPYTFESIVLPRRGREYFDGMNTHNTCIRYWNGKYYLYYFGTTYPDRGGRPIPGTVVQETWNRKRIGVAVADHPEGPFVRRDTPLLEPRDPRFFDCTITTNPTVAVLPSGKTYLIYKSRAAADAPMELGVAVAEKPDGPFTRLSDEPILRFPGGQQIEDPFLWYDEKRKKCCIIAKDCGCTDHPENCFTGHWGSGFYAESDDCVHFEIPEDPLVYTRELTYEDGTKSIPCNLERPSLLFDESGTPTHLFCAAGDGSAPYSFDGTTYVVCMKLG